MRKNKFFAFVIAAFSIAFSSTSPLFAKNLVEPGTCELVVASRRSLSQAQSYVRGIQDKRFVKIFKASNGWYAISIGALKPHEENTVINSWKRSNRIPQDSYCSTGNKYVALYDWRTGNRVNNAPTYASTTAATLQVYSPSDGYLNLRRSPTTNSSIIREMYNGQKVSVLDRSGNWLKVRHNSGSVGWAYSKYLVSTSRTVTAQATPRGTTQTGRCPGFNIITGCPGGFWDTVVKAAPTVIAGAAVVGEIGSQVCGSGGCAGAAPSAGASRSSASGNSNSSSQNNSNTTAIATGNVRKIEDWGTSPDGSSPQYKITCSNNTTHRYWRQSGEWWGPFGSVGLRNWDINRLANDRCS